MNLLIECVLAVDEQDAYAFATEEPSTLKTGKSRADDSHVITAHKLLKSPLLDKVTPGKDYAWSQLAVKYFMS